MSRWWNRDLAEVDLADVEPLIDPNPQPEDFVIPGHMFNSELLRATLHGFADDHLRGENALLREDLAERGTRLLDAERCVRELEQALDLAKPMPTREELGALIERLWHKNASAQWTTTEAWSRVADSVIDHVRGLWPVGERSPLAPDEVAALDGEAARLLAPQTSPGGGEAVAAGVSTAVATCGAPPSGDPVRDQLTDLIDSIINSGTHLAHPRADVARCAVAADHVLAAGWRPPTGTTVDQVPVVAALLTAHELMSDDTCRCGWGDWPEMPPHSEPAAVWHAEHVAEQLTSTGALA